MANRMNWAVVLRHGKKGEEKGWTDFLSPKGREDALNLLLPGNCKPIRVVAGSKEIRTITTGALICEGNAQNPGIVYSCPEFGDISWLKKAFDLSTFSQLVKNADDSVYKAMCKKLSGDDYRKLVKGMRKRILKIFEQLAKIGDDACALVISHSPYVELYLAEYHGFDMGKCDELGGYTLLGEGGKIVDSFILV
ncbi:MAG: histidine phosphatase family protein [Patescibacteria group bacterium]|nr:histidine phosphatase family protein [Patescibacteria group bacterium]